MTLRNFASKYKLPLNQVKAAVKNINHETDFDEETLIIKMTAYYMEDMRFCVYRANQDNEALKRLATGFNKNEKSPEN